MSTKKKTTITLKCDNPTCTTVLEWVDQESENVPDGFFRFTFEQRFVEKEGFKEFAFCSRRCSHEFDRTYVPPLSPREQARQMQANTAADKRVIRPAMVSEQAEEVVPILAKRFDPTGDPPGRQPEAAAPPTDTEIKVAGGIN